MKQDSGTVSSWQEKSDAPGRRFLRGMRLPLVLAAPAAAALAGDLGGDAGGEWAVYALLLAALVVTRLLWRYLSLRRRQSTWRGEPRVIGTLLARPAYPLPVRREWRWLSHPAVCVALAAALTVMLYWAVILNYLQLPMYWLAALIAMVIVNLWCWKQPLWLALFVGAGVGLLSLVGWLADYLSVMGALVLMAGVVGAAVVAVATISRRIGSSSVSAE
jgi:MFS family permease